MLTKFSANWSTFTLKITVEFNKPKMPASSSTSFSCAGNIYAGILIVQFTQQVFTIEHVAFSHTANATLVHLTFDDVSKLTG